MAATPKTVSISGSLVADRPTTAVKTKAIDLQLFNVASDVTTFTEAKQLDIYFPLAVTQAINLTELEPTPVKFLAITADQNIQVVINGTTYNLNKIGSAPAGFMASMDVTTLDITTLVADTNVSIGILA
jgi:hypothetical protein